MDAKSVTGRNCTIFFYDEKLVVKRKQDETTIYYTSIDSINLKQSVLLSDGILTIITKEKDTIDIQYSMLDNKLFINVKRKIEKMSNIKLEDASIHEKKVIVPAKIILLSLIMALTMLVSILIVFGITVIALLPGILNIVFGAISILAGVLIGVFFFKKTIYRKIVFLCCLLGILFSSGIAYSIAPIYLFNDVYTIFEIDDVSFGDLERNVVIKRYSVFAVQKKTEPTWVTKAICKEIIKKVKFIEDVNAVSVFIYYSESDRARANYICNVDYAPYGEWRRAEEVNAGQYFYMRYTWNFPNANKMNLEY